MILHERDIRKDLGDFAFLKTPALKAAFLDELTTLIEAAPFDLVCVVIDKAWHKARYKTPADPYNLALGFGLERVRGLLVQRGVWQDGPASQMATPPPRGVGARCPLCPPGRSSNPRRRSSEATSSHTTSDVARSLRASLSSATAIWAVR